MKGADEYHNLFRHTQQIGSLYLVVASHARGKTFRVFVLPNGEKAIPNGDCNPPLNPGNVEVYGIVGGQPGWTEIYGWLHEGPWKADFLRECKLRQKARDEKNNDIRKRKAKAIKDKEERIQDTLSQYENV